MAGELKPYHSYKESGVPWLGEVPAHWEMRRMKNTLRERIEKGFPDEPLLAATPTKGVVRKEEYENRTVLALKDLHLLKLVRTDDFVISLRSFQGGIEYAREQGIISPAYTILYPLHPENHGFLTWIFKSLPYIQNLALHVTGIRQGQNVDYEKLSRSEITLPPPDEQLTIVRYLNHVDRLIRRYIQAKQKLIKLLSEQKQAIIYQAVTRGLDPNVRLRPSGIQWMVDIPQHWDVLRSKYIFRESDVRSKAGTETHLSMSQKLGLIPSSQIEEKRLVSESYAGAKLCERGDLVLNRLKAHLGVFALATEGGLVSPDYTVLRPVREIEPRYFEAVYRTPACRVELRQRAKGIVQGFWRLYTDDFYDIRVPVPPLDEQRRIMERLNSELSVQDEAIARAERGIRLLREYWTRLVAEVVTGKVDVREAASRLPDEAEVQVDETWSEDETGAGADQLAEDGGDFEEEGDAEGIPTAWAA